MVHNFHRHVFLCDSSLDPAAEKHPMERQAPWPHQFRGVTLTDPSREGKRMSGAMLGKSGAWHVNVGPTGQSGRVQNAYFIIPLAQTNCIEFC